jgi:hypothetical protein
MILTATIRDEEGKAVGVLVLNEKTLTSGSRGFFGQGKLEINGAKHQAQVQLVQIGTKNEMKEAGHAN